MRNDEKSNKAKNNKEVNNNQQAIPYTICPDCGKPIYFENDALNGFCKDCAPNH